jgi:methyl-accepting chemotaxis protein
MKVWHKILIAPGVAIVFLLALGVTAYSVLTSQQGTLAELFEQRFGSYQLAARAVHDIGEVHSGVYRLFSVIGSLSEDKIRQTSSGLLAHVDAVSRDVSAFAARAQLQPEERRTAEAVVAKLAKYRKDVDLAIDLSTGDVNTGTAAMQTADADFQDMSKQLSELVTIETKLAQDGYDDARAAFAKVTVALLAIVALALVISIGIALIMSRRIVRPLQGAIAVAGRIASGDLSSAIRVEGADETAELSRALKDMNESLKRIVTGVRTGTDLVATASREIAQGNSDLSTRTEQQASALEETSASMQQMTATVGQNAQNAKKANELAAQASNVAAKGGAVVREAVGTMNDITEASKKIADIIGVIDGIAFQTNILALNAAVEAARAGEQGRGVAVVASEVRSLAQRSAAAAKEIKDLITDSVSKVDAGSRQVNDAGRTMEEVVDSVKKVTSLIAEITAASQEQAQGIEQVSETMTQLEKVTQQNAAMVEEASAAAGSLEEQSRALSSAVAAFRLGEELAQTVHAPKPAPKAASQAGTVEARPAEAPAAHLVSAKKPTVGKHVAPSVKKVEAHIALPKASARRKGNGHAEEGWQEF